MTTDDTLISRLERQKAELNSQIKKAKAEQAKKEAATQKKRCELVGATLLAHAENDTVFDANLKAILSAHITDKKQRLMLGLAPLSEPVDRM